MNRILQTLVLSFLLVAGGYAQQEQALLPADQEIPLKYGADRLGKRSDVAMTKFRENRLGLFIHWGLYAITGGEWNGKIYAGPSSFLQKSAGITSEQWMELMTQWKPEKFDANEWVGLAKKMGVKYIKLT